MTKLTASYPSQPARKRRERITTTAFRLLWTASCLAVASAAVYVSWMALLR